MEKYEFKSHIVGLLALFTMGNAAVTLPFYNSTNSLFVFLLTAVIALIFVSASVPILNFTLKRKIPRIIAAILVIAAALYGAVSAAIDYISFLNKIQMPRTSIVLITVALIVLVGCFTLCKNRAILKFCLLFAVITGAVLVLIFAVSVKMFDFGTIQLRFSFTGGELFAAGKIFFKYFSSLFAAVAFIVLTNSKARCNVVAVGTAAGLAGTALCLLQSVLVLGYAGYDFPYLYAVSAFSSGLLFTRLDGLVYFLFFAVSVVKIAVCVKTVQQLIYRFGILSE